MSDRDAPYRHEIFIDAPAAHVFEFLVDPAKMRLWMGMAHQLDARPGGIYRVDVIPGHVAAGTFREVDPPRRVVYSWGWEGPDSGVAPGSTLVEIDLVEQDDGTLVRLTHSGLPSDRSKQTHGQGWTHYCARLALAAAGRDAGPDPWVSRES